ncbi:hypothetical protein [Amphritea sp. HPY]|uniref:hypothetical protein n=1 Tax=Amphritea sp. HPY TaxID=3421652 RepID=UPI003D7DC5C0
MKRYEIGGTDLSPFAERVKVPYKEEVLKDAIRFYSVIEVGCLASALPKPLPLEFQESAGEELRALAEFLPPSDELSLRLVRLFQERLAGHWGEDQDDHQIDETIPIFSQFLSMNMEVENNQNIQKFLGPLTGSDDSAWQEILNALEDPTRVVERLYTHSTKGPLNQYIQGFSDYLEMVTGIDELLSLANEHSLLQSGIWHYHSEVLGNAVSMERLLMWFRVFRPLLRNVEHIDEEDVKNWGVATENALSRLGEDKYSMTLVKSMATA